MERIVLGAVIYHNHKIDERDCARGTDGCANPFFFVLGRNDDGYSLISLGHVNSL